VTVHLDPVLAVGAIAMAVIIGLLASTYPALMAARMDPNQSLKTI
jgi:putative ABC transport system permease protein